MAYEKNPIMNQNKGYAGQEKKDLMNDNPIAKDASGGRGGSWMSKHSQSKIGGGSPLKDKGHGGAEFSENHLSSGKHKSDLPGSAAKMNESALYHTSTGHGKHTSPERSHPDGKGGTISSHSHDTQSQQKKDKKISKKQKSQSLKDK